MTMETYKLSRNAARSVARYLGTYHERDDNSQDVAAALWCLVNGESDAVVLVDDEPEDES